MHSLKLIAGLGNPGRNHERDRHNVGFWFVSRLAAGERVELKPVARYHGLVGRLARPGGELRLVLPQTYMNLSGKSVGAIARFYKILPEEVLVVHDELDFPPGTAKLKLGGGVAGHNGLKDVAAQLGTQGFWRLRIGIGHPGEKSLVSDYVLNSPSPAEREQIEAALERCLHVSTLLLDGDMQAAMLKLHTAG
ncbi:MAG TPA: aminoacyl-tRNA hydrolase [Burkholderiales bacterium]|nr:aminoacyl-tRNA hydrolase [Burkholderiales bacterium]